MMARRSPAEASRFHELYRGRHNGTIGSLEKLAGITDRAAFWLPLAKFSDGFERGVRALNLMAIAKAEGR